VRPLPLSEIARYENEMLEYIRTRHGDVLKSIRDSGVLEDETAQKLTAALDEFAGVFAPAGRSDSQAA
jgi:F-type H+-transporting ATPase subunit alpha